MIKIKIVLEATGAADFDEIIKFLVALCKIFPGSTVGARGEDYSAYSFDANTPIDEIQKYLDPLYDIDFNSNIKTCHIGDIYVSITTKVSPKDSLWIRVEHDKYKEELDKILDLWKKTVTGKVDEKISTFSEE